MPWHQDEQASWLDVRLTVDLLSRGDRWGRVIDYGCGLGYYLNIISSELGIKSNCYGFDVSETAVAKTRCLFQEYTFRKADLTLNKNHQIALVTDSSSRKERTWV